MTRQSVRGSIIIDAPVDVVWEVVNDPATFVEGIDWVYEAHVEGGGALGAGSVYVERAKPGMKEGSYRWTITAYEEGHRSVHSHAGSELEADLEVFVEPLDDGRTRYTQDMQFRAMPGFRPLGWILERTVMKRKMQQDFENMILPNYKRIAERRHTEGSRVGG